MATNIGFQSFRYINTSSALCGKRNFRKFLLYNKRGSRSFKESQKINPDPDIPIDTRGVRPTGATVNEKYIEIPERIPELVVPDLKDCKLKPYVAYNVAEVVQSEFTSLDLFNAIYSQKIIDDFKSGKLNEDGSPIEPSIEEKLTSTEAWQNARKTGSDIF